MCGLSMLDWVMILIKLEGFFAKYSEPRLAAMHPLLAVDRVRGCEQRPAGFNQPGGSAFPIQKKIQFQHEYNPDREAMDSIVASTQAPGAY